MSNKSKLMVKPSFETKLYPQQLIFSWTIHRCLVHVWRKQKLPSSVFSATNDNFKWYLEFTVNTFPSRCNQMREDYISIELVPGYKEDDLRKFGLVSGSVEFSIMNNDTKAATQTVRFRFGSKDRDNRFAYISKFILVEEMKSLLNDEKLTILCSLGYVKENNVVDCDAEPVPNPADLLKNSESNVLRDLSKLLIDRDLSDLTISVRDKNFPVHKNILAARSTYFNNLFTSNTRDAWSRRIFINDIDPPVFENVLHFIYTGKPMNLEEFAYELLSAANKFDMKDLRKMCEDVLLRQYQVMI